jgi:hypothetical protein
LTAVGQFVASLGLEPAIRGDAVDSLFLDRQHRVEVGDVEARRERRQASPEELAMLAAGLPVG